MIFRNFPAPQFAVSVVTIASGRAFHLRNLVLGLCKQTTRPRELVVGVLQDELYDLPKANFPIRQIKIAYEGEIPLARARNLVADAADGEVIAFLDVDCIPAPTFVAEYGRLARAGSGVSMGEVMYLPQHANTTGWRYADFDAVAEKHADRQGPPPGTRERCTDYRCFWSLNFAMHRDDWHASGKFDEGYVGYGGEDTDFGRSLDELGMAIWWVRGAKVYHQYHPHAMPPVHHVASVIRNANRFADKWGHRTMEHWLYAFREMGLIRDGARGLEILREPDESDFALCRQEPDMPYATTSRVLKLLEERRRGRALSWREANASSRERQKELLGATRATEVAGTGLRA